MRSVDFDCYDCYGFAITPASLFSIEKGTPHGYEVLLELSHVAFGNRYSTLRAPAVMDDFGDLVLIAGPDGRVVLS